MQCNMRIVFRLRLNPFSFQETHNNRYQPSSLSAFFKKRSLYKPTPISRIITSLISDSLKERIRKKTEGPHRQHEHQHIIPSKTFRAAAGGNLGVSSGSIHCWPSTRRYDRNGSSTLEAVSSGKPYVALFTRYPLHLSRSHFNHR